MKEMCVIHVEGGHIQNRNQITKLIRGLKDGKYMMEVSKVSKRTNPMNRYLHGVLIPEFRKALNSVGYNEVKTDEQAKLILKSMFLTKEIPNETGGKPIHYVQDTSDMTKEEMSSLFDEVIQFCAEKMNYQILYPNEQVMLWE